MPYDIELTRPAETEAEKAAVRAYCAEIGFPLADDEPVHVMTEEGSRLLAEIRAEQGLDK